MTKKIISLIVIFITITIGYIYFQHWNNTESLKTLFHFIPGRNANELTISNITINGQKLNKISTLEDTEMIVVRGDSKPNSTLFISTDDPSFTSRIIKTDSSGHWTCHFPSGTFSPGSTIVYAQIFNDNSYSEKSQIARIIIGDMPRAKSLKPVVGLYSIVTFVVLIVLIWGMWGRQKITSPW